jgi:hypothetical protein
MAEFVYPTGSGALWPTGFTTPTSEISYVQPFFGASGNLSTPFGSVYPIAVPRIDPGATSGTDGNQYILPYSAQLFYTALDSIKAEYTERGATEPEFHAFYDKDKTSYDVLTNWSGLLDAPLENFHMVIEEAQNAISGLVCMSGWKDDMTDYLARAFDYRILMSGVPSGNRLSNNVSYYNVSSGSTITINPLDRARAGLFPINMEDAKHLNSQWGVAADGSRTYGTDEFGASGIAVDVHADRDPEFQQHAFMGHFDWLVQSIMWRPPFVESFTNGGGESFSSINFERGANSSSETHTQVGFASSGFADGAALHEPYSLGATKWVQGSNPDTIQKYTYTNSGNGGIADSLGSGLVAATDHGDVYQGQPTLTRYMPTSLYKYQDNTTTQFAFRVDRSSQTNFGIDSWDENTGEGHMAWIDYNRNMVGHLQDTRPLARMRSSMTGYAGSNLHRSEIYKPNLGLNDGDIVQIFEEVSIENATGSSGSMSVTMKDYFATGPNSAYGYHSGYINNSDSSIGITENDLNQATPFAMGGFARLSEIDPPGGWSIPAKVDASKRTGWPTYDPAAIKYTFQLNTTGGFYYLEGGTPIDSYKFSLAQAGSMYWAPDFHDRCLFAETELTLGHLQGYYSPGFTLTSPYYVVIQGQLSVAGWGVADAFNTYWLTSSEYDTRFLNYPTLSAPATTYSHGEFSSSGYVGTSHPMQSQITWAPTRASWSYPIGSGSEAEIDVVISSRPDMPAQVTNITGGREDWDGLHFVFTTSKHLPTFMGSPSGSRYDVRAQFNIMSKRRGSYDGQTESDQYLDVHPGTYAKLGLAIDAQPTGHSNLPFDASGNRASGWTYLYGEPNLLQEYFTCGGWAPHLVGSTSVTTSRGNSATFREDDREHYSYAATEFADFNDVQSYVVYGDGILKSEIGDGAFPLGEAGSRSIWENGPSQLSAQPDLPSGIHHSHTNLKDLTPSGTVYTVDMWDKFTTDMDVLSTSWDTAYYGESHAAETEDGPAVSVQTIENLKNAIASSGSTNPDPPIGYQGGEGLGIELENISFIDLAMAEEGVGLGADGVSYTLNSFWLKFPIILGPDGIN